METPKKKAYPEGYFPSLYTGLGVALSTGLLIPVLIAFDLTGLIGIGPAIGAAIGYALGQERENGYRKAGRIRELTEDERRKRKALLKYFILIGLFVLLVITFLVFS